MPYINETRDSDEYDNSTSIKPIMNNWIVWKHDYVLYLNAPE